MGSAVDGELAGRSLELKCVRLKVGRAVDVLSWLTVIAGADGDTGGEEEASSASKTVSQSSAYK